MLTQLTISNFAIIDHLNINYRQGLNILSGETGAGKSIIINAVNLILGGRASSDLIRSGADEAKVEALFNIPEDSSIQAILLEMGIACNGELLIRRTISREGRNRIMVNSSIATLQQLTSIGQLLISISGQHEHQLLLKPDNHLFFLDDFGGLTQDRESLNTSFEEYQTLVAQERRLEREIREGSEKQDLAKFQVDEIDGADLKEDEETLLEEERMRLRNAEMLMEIVSDAYDLLYEKEGAIVSEVSRCLKEMEKGEEVDSRLGRIKENLQTVRVDLEETALELRDFKKHVVIDPARLEEVEERLQVINRLKRKYGKTIPDILTFRQSVSGKMLNLDQKKEELQVISNRIEESKSEMALKASALSERRKKVAKRLEKSVSLELDLLDMEGTRFEVRFQQCEGSIPGDHKDIISDLKRDGIDRVEFMIAPNIGEELKPLSRTASGGELSRIMLGLKSILAKKGSIETVIFDEVDSGIGGATAEVVGDKLRTLAKYHQILCITHLPQIACKGANHFLVKKEVIDSRTKTFIAELDSDERVKEIARLLGGKRISEKALAHARDMLGISD